MRDELETVLTGLGYSKKSRNCWENSGGFGVFLRYIDNGCWSLAYELDGLAFCLPISDKQPLEETEKVIGYFLENNK